MEDSLSLKSIIENSLSNNFDEISILPTLINFTLCLILSFLLRYFYVNRSHSLVGKNHIGSIIPILSGIVFIVIIIVKSSLALSLGLVGALSIVRFRTPIKEPEELVYLFFAIAIGLGYGANQTIITTILSLILIVILHFWLSIKKDKIYNLEFNLSLTWSNKKVTLDDLISQIEDKVSSIKVIKVDYNLEGCFALIMIEPKKNIKLDNLVNLLKEKSNEVECTFTESNMNW
tara:strand:+ start:2910 stop:3605 length:696 start_codon:yes stop_codon:yes gene_type:complete